MASVRAWGAKPGVKSSPVAAPRDASVCLPRTDLTEQPIKLGRLKKRSGFLFVAKGKSQVARNLVIQTRKHRERESGLRVGFTATKKIGGAVTRNRAKRRLREVARALLPALGKPGYDYVFIARMGTAGCGWKKLLSDAEKALLRLQ